MTIGQNIRTIRLRKGRELKASAIELGVAPGTWADWESGRTAPRHHRLAAIAKLLGVSVARLIA